MAPFIYYIPDGTERSFQQDAERVGLGGRFDFDDEDAKVFKKGDRGPDDGRGVFIRQDKSCQVDYDNQVWQEFASSGFWVGYDAEDPPTPEDLERDDTVSQYAPKLGDGNNWKIPTAAGFDEDYCPLPKSRQIDPKTGQIQRRPRSQYDQLRLYADELRDRAINENDGEIAVEREVDIVMEALSTNYRIGIEEASTLELLTDQATQWIVWVLIDRLAWPDAREELAEMEDDE